MKALVNRILSLRIWSLCKKELRQIQRNRRLVVLLVIPPTIQMILFGYSLNPEVRNLRIGVVDASNSSESRELISAFVESGTFVVTAHYPSSDAVGTAISDRAVDAALIIPPDFARLRARGRTASVQILLDATNSNTAAIAGGYASRIVAALNQKLETARRKSAAGSNARASAAVSAELPISLAMDPPPIRYQFNTRIALLYNPGLESPWFIATGMIGTLLIIIGSVVAAASMVKEKETGTIEQLLMTPAEASEIIVAKMAPLLLLLSGDIGLALLVCKLIFGVPLRGSLLMLVSAGMLCVLCGIGIGIFNATFTKSQQQAQLMGFFINPPLAMLSGVMTPIEAMPKWMQVLTYANPVRHFATISRGVMLKGAGLDILYPNLLALAIAATLLVGLSTWRFRKQLG